MDIEYVAGERYPVFYQKPYHCAMSCLQMAVFRRTGRLFDQEWLGKRFGVKVPSSEASVFRHALSPILPDGFLKGGIPTVDSVETTNRFFDEFHIPLSAKAVRPSDAEFGILEKKVPQWLARGADIWTEFIIGEKGSSRSYRHDCLVERFDSDTKDVTLLDPDPHSQNRRNLKMEEWKSRMDGTYGEPTGIVLLFPK